MHLERRALLKLMALGGLAGVTLGRPGLTTAQVFLAAQLPPPAPTLVLVDTATSAFLAGVGASPTTGQIEVQRADLGLSFILGLEQHLRSDQPQCIIGLVDTACAVLIVDQARSAGARLPWLAQHHVTTDAARHRPFDSAAASGHTLQLVRRLDACGSGSEQWAATLGHALATPGRGDIGLATPLADRSAPLTGHFVSFAIET